MSSSYSEKAYVPRQSYMSVAIAFPQYSTIFWSDEKFKKNETSIKDMEDRKDRLEIQTTNHQSLESRANISVDERKWLVRDYQAMAVGLAGASIGPYCGYTIRWHAPELVAFLGGIILFLEAGVCRVLDNYSSKRHA